MLLQTVLIRASVAGPPSPENPSRPVPATVLTSPDGVTFTILPSLPTYRFPSGSTVPPWASTLPASPGAGSPPAGGPTTVVITPDGSILRTRTSASLMYRLPCASKPMMSGPLIEASVAGPPSPLDAAKPFPATVVIVPIGSPEEADEVATGECLVDRSIGSADFGSDPEQAVVPSASVSRVVRTATAADVRVASVESRCLLIVIHLPPQSISNSIGLTSAMQLVSGGAVGASIQLALMAREHSSVDPGRSEENALWPQLGNSTTQLLENPRAASSISESGEKGSTPTTKRVGISEISGRCGSEVARPTSQRSHAS